MAYHDDLLTQAGELLHKNEQNSNQADLRRAVSSAYYAIFHELCSLVADQFIGRDRRATKEYARCYRTLNHQNVAKGAALYAKAGGADESAHFVCNTAKDARIERNLADYDPHYQATADNVLMMV